jgi:putative aldouronate transport system permease protein
MKAAQMDMPLNSSSDPNAGLRPKTKKELSLFAFIWKHKVLYLFLLPGIVWFVIFAYLPMAGVIMAFQQYDPVTGFLKSPFIGFDNFNRLFDTPRFMNALHNTLIISALKLGIGFPLPVLFALLFNEIRKKSVKKMAQTISYLPYFISWTVAAGIWYKLLSPDGGVINEILLKLGWISKPIFFMSSHGWFYPIIIWTDQWKNLGFSAIIYFAALASIDSQLYEAAKVDGAGILRQMWHISLPSLKPTIILLFILAVSNLLNADFDQMWNMTNPTILDKGDILDTFILRSLTTGGLSDLSVGAAVGLFKAAIGFALFLVVNYTSKLFKQESLL